MVAMTMRVSTEQPPPEPSARLSGSSPFDAYTPAEVARQVETIGCAKALRPTLPTFTLGLLAGGFIAFGGMFYTLVMTGVDPSYGPARLLGGVAFSLGLILVIVGGAELFTGNNLLVMAWAERRISTRLVLSNWGLVYVANLVGALGAVVLVHLSGTLAVADGGVAPRQRWPSAPRKRSFAAYFATLSSVSRSGFVSPHATSPARCYRSSSRLRRSSRSASNTQLPTCTSFRSPC
jgi:hypothetical protein